LGYSVRFCAVYWWAILSVSVLFIGGLFCPFLFCLLVGYSVRFCAVYWWAILSVSVLFIGGLFCPFLCCLLVGYSVRFCAVYWWAIWSVSVLFIGGLLCLFLQCRAVHKISPAIITSCHQIDNHNQIWKLPGATDTQYAYKHNIDARSRNHSCRGKVMVRGNGKGKGHPITGHEGPEID
jgi:hypothetical protein